MKTSTKIEIGLLALACLVSISLQLFMRNNTVRGEITEAEFEGELMTTTYNNMAEFSEVQLESEIPVEIIPGDPKIVMSSSQEWLDNMVYDNNNGVLRIKQKNRKLNLSRSLKKKSIITIYIDVPLSRLVSSGNSIATVKDIGLSESAKLETYGNSSVTGDLTSAINVDIITDGNSSVNLTGSAEKLQLKSDGNSGLTLHNFPAKEINLSISGNSWSEIYAIDAVEIYASGNSSVELKGNPDKSKATATGNSRIKNFE